MRKILFTALLIGLCSSIGSAQSPDLVLNPGSSYVDVGRGIPWGSTFNRTYVLVPNSPNASVCIYVVNNNPTSAHTFTSATFQSADSQVADFSNNGGRFSSVPLLSMPTSVPAATMVSGFTQSTAAAKVAIKFSASAPQAGSPDTADVFIVQTTSGTCGTASSVPMVQGTSAPGTPGLGNPVLIGGLDNSNNAQFYRFANHASGTSNVEGFPIGSLDSNNGSVYAQHRLPGGASDGPLATTLFAANGTQSANAINLIRQTNIGNSCSATTGCPGLLVADAGFFNGTGTQTIASGTTTFALWQVGLAQTGVVQTCHFEVFGNLTAGSAGTLDFFIQDSPDGTNWNDRIHFAQITTGPSRQAAGIAGGSANGPVGLTTSGTIAVSTIVSGPLDGYGRGIAIVAGGTAPQYSVSVNANCK